MSVAADERALTRDATYTDASGRFAFEHVAPGIDDVVVPRGQLASRTGLVVPQEPVEDVVVQVDEDEERP